MGSFSLAHIYSWCCCFKTETDADEIQYGGAQRGYSKEQQTARDLQSGQAQSTNNGQMQPTLPPLPELRPLDPLEPFKDMRRSIDPGGASTTPDRREDQTTSSS